MSTLTIRKLDAQTHAGLRRRAAINGRSVEAEVRAILDATISRPDRNLLVALHEGAAVLGGFDLDLAPRSTTPRVVDLG